MAQHTASPEAFIRFIGPIYTPTHLYADNVLSLLPVANQLIAETGSGGSAAAVHADATHGTSETPPKPVIKEFIQSPNHSSRNGTTIRRVIMHYTTSRNVEGTIAWFKDPASKVSAHYVIARTGDIYQMVRDSDKAWHAKNANAD